MSPGGWECFVEDMVEAGPRLMADGRLDPARLNRIAGRHGITYEEDARHGQGCSPLLTAGGGNTPAPDLLTVWSWRPRG